MNTLVLVIDDSATVRQEVSTALKQAGFTVIEASDGIEGKTRINAMDIKCVICDINMPNKNGLDLVEEIKTDSRHKALPILMLTTEGAPDLVGRAKKAGAVGWIVKPFKAEMLVAAVRKLTSK